MMRAPQSVAMRPEPRWSICALRALVVEHAEPERDGGQDRVLVKELRLVQLVHALLPSLAVRAAARPRAARRAGRWWRRRRSRARRASRSSRWPPTCARTSARAPRRELLVVRRRGQLLDAAQRLDPETLHVNLFVRRVERAALDPAVAEARVLDEAVAVRVGRRREAVGFEDRLPVGAQEFEVAARAHSSRRAR